MLLWWQWIVRPRPSYHLIQEPSSTATAMFEPEHMIDNNLRTRLASFPISHYKLRHTWLVVTSPSNALVIWLDLPARVGV